MGKALRGVFVASFAALTLLTTGFTYAVHATDPADISIPVSTIIRGDKDSLHELAKVDVSQDMVGYVCSITARGENQGSVHPGNDLIIKSNGTQVELSDVEREANVVTNANGQLTLGNDITVTLKLGQDKVFSAGMDVEFNCEEPVEPIYSCNAVNILKLGERKVEVSVDATATPSDLVTISGYSYNFGDNSTLDSSKSKVSHTYQEDGNYSIKVVVSFDINEETYQDSCSADIGFDTPEELPETGATSVIASLFSISALGGSIKAWFKSKKNMKNA